MQNTQHHAHTGPQNVEELFRIAQKARGRGALDEAIAAFRALAAADPDNKKSILLAAQGLRDCDRPADVVAVLEDTLSREPGSVAMLELMAGAHLDLGAPEAALSYLERAAAIQPNSPEPWINLATVYRTLGRWTDAAEAFRALAAADPHNKKSILTAARGLRDCDRPADVIAVFERAPAWISGSPSMLELMASAYFDLDAPETALSYLERAVAIVPDSPEYWINLATVYRALERWTDAAEAYTRALRLEPTNVDAALALGDVLYKLGRDPEAAYRRALAGAPAHSQTLFKLGSLLMDRNQLEEAKALLQSAVKADADNVEAHVNLGLVYLHSHAPADATAAARTALALDAASVAAQHLLGAALLADGNRQEAVAVLRRVAEKGGAKVLLTLAQAEIAVGEVRAARHALSRVLIAEPENQRARMLLESAGEDSPLVTMLRQAFAKDRAQRLSEACGLYEQALTIDPANIFALSRLLTIAGVEGKLADAQAYHRRLFTSLAGARLQDVAWQHLAVVAYQAALWPLPRALYDEVVAALDRQLLLGGECPTLTPSPLLSDRRLKIGYLSTNFRDHPIGHVTAALFAAHDRSRFEVHAIYFEDGPRARYTEEIAAGVEHFITIDGESTTVEQTVAALGLDILIYLDGFMTLPLLPVVARRCAPVQIFWLGHAGGCDLANIDYLIADAAVVPPGEEGLYKPKVVRLPDTYHCASAHPVAAVPTRASADLPQDGFVFCAFNNPEKIDLAVFETWMEILKRVEGSVLWLTETHSPAIADNLRLAAKNHGVAAERLVFARRLPDKADHLARQMLAGLFLDTFSLSAATTALDALWVGLPVLTVAGDRFASRMAASFLHALGMDSLVTPFRDAYIERAVFLATHPEALAELRAQTAAHRDSHPLFRTDRFCRNLEDCLKQLWRDHPRPDS